MDQLKEFLRQAAKYRFWIAIGVACLLPLIAFFVGTGAMADQQAKEEAKIKGANDGAKAILNQTVKNNDWKKVVDEKTALVTADVTTSHKMLYGRQKPLLTWPEPVADMFKAWGPKYPEGLDAARVDDILLTYTQSYPDYVDKVYASLNAFDPETGKGIVAAPSLPTLLMPEVFREEKRPSVNDVWMAQRRLWIQATLLKVIADVNDKAKAKTWDQAPIKQLLWMEIATEGALDQRTAALADQLEDPKPILAPGQAAPEKTEKAAADAGLGLGTAATSSPGTMKFVKSSNPDQYFVVPVAMELLVEQDKIPDLLVEFRNSPMSIVIKDFKWTIPAKPITKPKKGQTATAFDGAGSNSGRAGGLAGRQMGDDMGSGSTGPSMEDMQGGKMSKGYNEKAKGGRGVMSKGLGTQGADAKAKSRENSTDVKGATLQKLQAKKKGGDKAKEKANEDDEAATSANPYYNVVQVTIRGQARFYQAPPDEPVKAETPGNAPGPKADSPKVPPTADTKVAAPKDEAPKADAPKDAAKADAKAAPNAEVKAAPKADAKGTPKADAEKPKDTPKPEPAKDAPKADAEKPKDTPKGDGETPKD